MATELHAWYWWYCQELPYAHCGYHPCTCEEGSTEYGCEAGYYHAPTGVCDRTINPFSSCQAPALSCGKRVSYQSGNCSDCGVYSKVTFLDVDCVKRHGCS